MTTTRCFSGCCVVAAQTKYHFRTVGWLVMRRPPTFVTTVNMKSVWSHHPLHCLGELTRNTKNSKLRLCGLSKRGGPFFSSVKTHNRLRRDIWRIRVNEHFWNVILFNLNLAIAFLGLLWNLETYIRKYLTKGIFYHEQLIHKRFRLEVAYNRKEKFLKC